jgi:hypothetical protein
MLEILLLIALTRRIGRMLESKGRASGGYKVLAVALWFGGEIVGMMIGILLSGRSETFAYIVALVGAAVGAGIAYHLAQEAASATLEKASNTTAS